METDKEVSGTGNSYTTQFRQYDPRLGRWKSLDPLAGKFPWMSPFVGMDNNPISLTDPLGLESKGGDDKVDPDKKTGGKDDEVHHSKKKRNGKYRRLEIKLTKRTSGHRTSKRRSDHFKDFNLRLGGNRNLRFRLYKKTKRTNRLKLRFMPTGKFRTKHKSKRFRYYSNHLNSKSRSTNGKKVEYFDIDIGEDFSSGIRTQNFGGRRINKGISPNELVNNEENSEFLINGVALTPRNDGQAKGQPGPKPERNQYTTTIEGITYNDIGKGSGYFHPTSLGVGVLNEKITNSSVSRTVQEIGYHELVYDLIIEYKREKPKKRLKFVREPIK